MNLYSGTGGARRLAAIVLSLLMAFTVMALATGQADARKKAKKAKVTLKVLTKNQKQLIRQGKLTVRVRATGKVGKVKLSARGFKRKAVKLNRKGAKTVKLAWTQSGRFRLRQCRAQSVRVTGKYRGRKATTKKKLARGSNCVKAVKVNLGPDPTGGQNPKACDFLDTTVCLQPFPNDYYTKKDKSSKTGLRLNLDRKSTPVNTGAPVNRQRNVVVTDLNRADGFSPGSLITLKVPGLDTPAAFQNSGLVGLEKLSEYSNRNQPVILIDARTGKRQMIWAEIDANPTSVDPGPGGPGGINANPSNTGPVNLLVRPGKNLEFGHRYIIAFRNLKDADNNAIPAPLGFRVYRDGLPTNQNVVEQRRGHMNSLIKTLTGKAGVKRSSLYMAWDFTVASEQSVTGRATTIRDDAFKRLGDTDLANRTIEGDSPDIEVLAWCDKSDPAATQATNGHASCSDAYPPADRNNYPGIASYNPGKVANAPNPGVEEQRTVVGLIKNVPCYMNQDGCPANPVDPASFEFKPNGDLTWNPAYRMDVPFRCRIPMSTVSSGTVIPGGTGTYGHGLLGTLNQINATRAVSNINNSTWCAANWDGFSDLDLGVVLKALGDMSYFNSISDRMQQGMVNFLMLQRALAHPQGMAQEDAFKMTHNGAVPVTNPGLSAIDTSDGMKTRGMYYGISQGAIMGGALTALNPDVDRGALGVAGMNYSTLLRRSVDSDEYFKDPAFGLYKNYPDYSIRPVLLNLMQLTWDRGESNGYAHNMTDKPLPNTNPHAIYMDVALGDHQVTNFAADVQARTIGALRYAPTLMDSRHNWDLDYAGLPAVESTNLPTTAGESYMQYFDVGPFAWDGNGQGPGGRSLGVELPPLENVAPQPAWGYGDDPHGDVRYAPDNYENIAQFLDEGTIHACGGTGGLCFANAWDGTTGLP